MRPAVIALATSVLVSLSGCQKEEVTSYRVPKEPEPALKMPADHHHAGVAKNAPASGSGAAPASASTPATQAPASGGGSMANTPVTTASGGELTWKGPAHWQEKPAGSMRKGTFAITGEGGSAELAITAFPGNVGGEAANVNRWRGQLELPPVSPNEATGAIQRLEHNGLKVGVVELVGTSGGKPTRVLGAMVPHAGATWFFKLTGPDALVAKEKPAFLEFLKTVKPAGK